MSDVLLNAQVSNVTSSGLLSRDDAAKYVGRRPKTLAEWKVKGIGPKFRKVQGRIFYDLKDLEEFMRGT